MLTKKKERIYKLPLSGRREGISLTMDPEGPSRDNKEIICTTVYAWI